MCLFGAKQQSIAHSAHFNDCADEYYRLLYYICVCVSAVTVHRTTAC